MGGISSGSVPRIGGAKDPQGCAMHVIICLHLTCMTRGFFSLLHKPLNKSDWLRWIVHAPGTLLLLHLHTTAVSCSPLQTPIYDVDDGLRPCNWCIWLLRCISLMVTTLGAGTSCIFCVGLTVNPFLSPVCCAYIWMCLLSTGRTHLFPDGFLVHPQRAGYKKRGGLCQD